MEKNGINKAHKIGGDTLYIKIKNTFYNMLNKLKRPQTRSRFFCIL